ncbi:hypothetical protein FNB79_11740 [Formosa sediminum]|uniref:Porin family protein n=1 Tax=Formosa sediminum TaxID=2594004 RepID=A0A516GSX8_9FLAO|nr:hypothetical protein [Formosa sediminum]QDO94608.1 hypothetical protein FNB79_11740 [Formosa sediminum]
MKTYILTVMLSCFSIQFINAQFSTSHAIYTTGELNLGNYIGFDLNLNYVYKETYSLKIGYTGNLRTPKSQPENYSSGFESIFSFGTTNPYDQLENIQIGAGKIYKLNTKGTIRLNLSAGLGYTIIREPENWHPIDNPFLTENYTWQYRKYNTLSFVLNPKIEFPISKIYGLTVSPLLILNKDRTYIGIGIGQMLGVLRP